MNNLCIRVNESELFEAGIGYVIIPSDVERDKYIRTCYQTLTVSIFSEHNGVSNRVPVDSFSINFIAFPSSPNEFGTAVMFTVDPVLKRPMVVGIYNQPGQVGELHEHQFKFKRQHGNKFVELAGSASENYMGLSVKTDKGGEAYVKVASDDDTGQITLEVSGNINLTASNKTTIRQFDQIAIVTSDEDNEERFAKMEQTTSQHLFQDDEHKINTKKLQINDGDEPFVLGKKLKSFFDDLIEELANSTVTTALGQMPLLNKVQIMNFKNRTDALLSSIASLDR